MLSMARHLRDQDMSLRDIAARLVVTTGKTGKTGKTSRVRGRAPCCRPPPEGERAQRWRRHGSRGSIKVGVVPVR